MAVSDSRVRPTRDLRTPRAVTPPALVSREVLEAQVRRSTRDQDFDRGFAKAIELLERGATLEDLRAATGVVRHSWCTPRMASDAYEDTVVQTVPVR